MLSFFPRSLCILSSPTRGAPDPRRESQSSSQSPDVCFATTLIRWFSFCGFHVIYLWHNFAKNHFYFLKVTSTIHDILVEVLGIALIYPSVYLAPQTVNTQDETRMIDN